MKINDDGLNIIKEQEGLYLTGYQDKFDNPTVGYGHCGPDVKVGMTITKDEAENLLRSDVSWAEAGVARLVKVPLNENQFSALVSLVFNIGVGHFAGSPVLASLKNHKYLEAAENFMFHCHNHHGDVLPGLQYRRKREAALFMKD